MTGEISISAKILVFCANILIRILNFLPVDNGKVVYWARGFNLYGNAAALCSRWRTIENTRHIYLLSKKNRGVDVLDHVKYVPFRSIMALFHISTCRYLIKETDIVTPPLNIRPETRVVQLWHGAGAFKKFGFDIKNRSETLSQYRMKDAKRWDLLLCSSELVKKIYANAFKIEEENKIYVDGLPRNDFLFCSIGQKSNIKYKYGFPAGRKIILFAPTFRDDHSASDIFREVISVLQKKLSDEYVVCVRLHPSCRSSLSLPNGVFDCSLFDPVEEILAVTDILITDYSSIIFDFSCLKRPMFFYAPDLSKYVNDRDFYFGYEGFVPGPVCFDSDSLIHEINRYDPKKWVEEITNFQQKYNPHFDGKSSERIIERILNL